MNRNCVAIAFSSCIRMVGHAITTIRQNIHQGFSNVAAEVQSIKDQIAQQIRTQQQSNSSSPTPAKVRKTQTPALPPTAPQGTPQLPSTSTPIKLSAINIASSAPDTLIISTDDMDDSMTSLGCKRVVLPGWNPTYTIQGQLCHRIGTMFPERNNSPQFLQIYFLHSHADQAQHRLSITGGNSLHPHIMDRLSEMLHQEHKYVRHAAEDCS
jgi:hypothetical protein